MSQLNGVRFDIQEALNALTRLRLEHPELADDEELLRDCIEGQTNAFEVIDRLLEVMQEAKFLQAAIGDEIECLDARKDRMARREQYIRRGLMAILDLAQLRKAERPLATISIAAGRPKTVITDESELPEQFIRTKREPNKEEIAKALKDGITVPGATLSNSAPTLLIRT